MSFNWLVYKLLNPDLEKNGVITKEQICWHYIIHGKKENRLISIYQLYPDFNPIAYKNKYSDLSNMTIEELKVHWISHGKSEGRQCNNSEDYYNYINGIDMIYWINLDRSIDRRVHMEGILSKINVPNKRISASDGKLDSNMMSNFNIISSDIISNRTNSEYACLLSHLRTVKEFYESSKNICMILEDDISLDFTKFWHKDINKIIEEAPNDWEIIMLSYTVDKPNLLNDLYTKISSEIYSTLSFLINKRGAEKIMKKFNNNKWMIDDKIHTSDYVLYNNCNTYTYKYCYFTINDNMDSTIHNNHLDLHAVSKNYSKYMWLNFIKI